jgi:putative heme transporter
MLGDRAGRDELRSPRLSVDPAEPAHPPDIGDHLDDATTSPAVLVPAGHRRPRRRTRWDRLFPRDSAASHGLQGARGVARGKTETGPVPSTREDRHRDEVSRADGTNESPDISVNAAALIGPSDISTHDEDDHHDHDHDLVEHSTPRKKSKWKHPIWALGIVLIAVIIFIALQGKLPSPAEIGQALASAEWWWVLLAAGGMGLSIFTFAMQQWELLAAFDARIGRRRMIVITAGGTAMTNALPAGAAVAAGFSFRQYRLSGANRSTAATVMVLSGLLSVATLALMYFLVLGAATATPWLELLRSNPVIAILIALLLVGLVWLLVRRSMARRPQVLSDAPTPRLDRWETRWPKVVSFLRDALDTMRQARLVKIRYMSAAVGWSLLKWVAEGICLLAACRAFDIYIDFVALCVVYLSVQLVRQVPFTPGGIGLVEASLLAGLVAAGAPHGASAAAVLVYRLLSAWIVIPVGFALLAELKRRDARRALRA